MKRPLICTPVRAETQEEALRQLQALHQHPRVDMAELWLDAVRERKDIGALLEQAQIPVLCVNKLPEDQGAFSGSDQQLVDELLEAARYGAWGISVPTERLGKGVLGDIRTRLDQIIEETGKSVNFAGEHHYWPPKDVSSDKKLPPDFDELAEVAARMTNLGVDTAKIVTYAKDPADTAVAFTLSHYIRSAYGKKPIVLTMGQHGASTRLNPINEMMFAPVDPAQATAPGQYTVDQLHSIFEERFKL